MEIVNITKAQLTKNKPSPPYPKPLHVGIRNLITAKIIKHTKLAKTPDLSYILYLNFDNTIPIAAYGIISNNRPSVYEHQSGRLAKKI